MAAAAAPEQSSLTFGDLPALPMVVPDIIQKVIRVLREPGVALGMSVAGGIGALPDTHDEVRCDDYITFRIMYFSLILHLIVRSVRTVRILFLKRTCVF